MHQLNAVQHTYYFCSHLKKQTVWIYNFFFLLCCFSHCSVILNPGFIIHLLTFTITHTKWGHHFIINKYSYTRNIFTNSIISLWGFIEGTPSKTTSLLAFTKPFIILEWFWHSTFSLEHLFFWGVQRHKHLYICLIML